MAAVALTKITAPAPTKFMIIFTVAHLARAVANNFCTTQQLTLSS